MKINKKIVALGLIGLFILTGCASNSVETTQPNSQTSDVNEGDTQVTPQQSTEPSIEPVDPSIEQDNGQVEKTKEEANKEAESSQSEVKSIVELRLLMGQKSDKVREVLGEPKESQKLEETQILLADRFIKEVVGQKVSVEVIYDDAEGKVNFINIKCVKADNVESFVERFESELVQSFGKGSIEKTIDVRGTKRKEWDDEILTYALSYIENDVTLDIYPIHE